MDVLVVCTANQCRSPMAEALLRGHLAARGVGATVSSVGTYRGGVPASPGAVKAMAARGLDIAAHRSRTLEGQAVQEADLVLGMARSHVREAVLLAPDAWTRCFTLKELVRRGEEAGPRQDGEDLEGWLHRVAGDRTRSGLLGDSPEDDVADPIGGPDKLYVATAEELDDLLRRLVDLAWPVRSSVGGDGRRHGVEGA